MKRFKTRWEEYKRWKYPSLPDIAICFPVRKYPTRTTNGMTKIIKEYLFYKGWQCERVSNMGVRMDMTSTVIDVMGMKQTIGNYKWRKGSGQIGTADLAANIDGKTVKIEVKNKTTNDRKRKEQERYRDMIVSSGGIYLIATDVEQILDELDKFADNPNKEWFWEVSKR